MATQPAALTYGDLVRIREQGDDHLRYELIDGELIVTPAPRTKHQWVIMQLVGRLWTHIDERSLGVLLTAPLDVILHEGSIVQPDIVFLAKDCGARLVGRGVEGVPALVVEVLSPSMAAYDRGAKRALYERAGVPHLWLLDPLAQSLEADVLRNGRYERVAALTGAAEFRPALFPGLVIALGTIWPPPGAIADE